MSRSKLSPAPNTARYPSRKGLAGVVGAVALIGALGCGEPERPVDASGVFPTPDAGPTQMDAGVGPVDAAPEPTPTDASGIWPADAE